MCQQIQQFHFARNMAGGRIFKNEIHNIYRFLRKYLGTGIFIFFILRLIALHFPVPYLCSSSVERNVRPNRSSICIQ